MRGNVLPKNVYILGEELNFNYLQFGFNWKKKKTFLLKGKNNGFFDHKFLRHPLLTCCFLLVSIILYNIISRVPTCQQIWFQLTCTLTLRYSRQVNSTSHKPLNISYTFSQPPKSPLSALLSLPNLKLTWNSTLPFPTIVIHPLCHSAIWVTNSPDPCKSSLRRPDYSQQLRRQTLR